jgi:multicomponent Na+:H+ antiporter subunit F
MHELVFFAAVVWLTVLLGASAAGVARARNTPSRILALDMLVLILIALLVVFADARRSAVYLDAALLLTVLSFVATLAAARYHAEGRIF